MTEQSTMAALKDWKEEEYKNQERSAYKLLSMGLTLHLERMKMRLLMMHFMKSMVYGRKITQNTKSPYQRNDHHLVFSSSPPSKILANECAFFNIF